MVSGHQLQMIMCLLEAKSRSRLSFLHDCCHKPFATVSCHPCNFLALDPLNLQPLQRGRERERMIHHVRIVSLTVAPQWCMSHPTLGKSQIVSGIVVASARFNRLRGFIGIKGVENHREDGKLFELLQVIQSSCSTYVIRTFHVQPPR